MEQAELHCFIKITFIEQNDRLIFSKLFKPSKEKGDMSETDVVSELKAIRKDLNYIKEHMIDSDTILTPAEEKVLEQSLKDYKEGKTCSLIEFERPKK